MFRWTGTLDRAPFVRNMGLALVYLVATTVGFRFVLQALTAIMGCARGGDSCNGFGLVISFALRPALFVIFLFLVGNACIRRARDADLPPWVGAYVPLMMAANMGIATALGSGWSYAFSLGILAPYVPWFLIFGLVCAVLLAVPKRGAFAHPLPPRIKHAWIACAALVTLFAWGQTAGALVGLGFAIRVFLSASSLLVPLAMLPFLAVSVMALKAVGHGIPEVAAPSEPLEAAAPSERASVPSSPWRLKLPIALAFAISIGAVTLALARTKLLNPLALPIFLVPMILPTFIVYFLPIAAASRFAQLRSRKWLVLTLVALLPFVSWMGRVWAVHEAKAREAGEIAKVETVPLRTKVTSVVLEGGERELGLVNCVRARLLSETNGIDEVFTSGGKNGSFLRYSRATAKAPVARGIQVEALPDSYLALALDSRRFVPPRAPLDGLAPPVEAYSVIGGTRDLASLSYTTLHRYPFAPPVLAGLGWYWGNNDHHVGECGSTIDFVSDLLRRAPKE
jgi:hypothetical protein